MHEPQVYIMFAADDADGGAERTSQGVHRDLHAIDPSAVRAVDAADAPAGAKGLGTVAGWLAVQVAAAGGLRAVIGVIRDWALRSQRTIKVSVDGDMLELTNVTSAQQERVIEAFIVRHSSDS